MEAFPKASGLFIAVLLFGKHVVFVSKQLHTYTRALQTGNKYCYWIIKVEKSQIITSLCSMYLSCSWWASVIYIRNHLSLVLHQYPSEILLTWRIKTKARKKKQQEGRIGISHLTDTCKSPSTHSSCCSRALRRVSLATQVSTFTWPTFTSIFLERNFRNKIHFGAQLPWTNTGGSAPHGTRQSQKA